MSMHKIIDEVFQDTITQFNACEGMQRFWRGEVSKRHYACYMREVFHHARENPQIQATATAFFRGSQRDMVKPFLKHAVSEIGHDQLALNDARSAGLDVTSVPTEMPLPATTALVAFAYFQIYNHNPVGYLGYLYYLEHMPTAFGAEYIRQLAQMGLGPETMTFLADHASIDVGHNAMMREYIDHLVKDQQALDAVCYAVRVTGYLYGAMVTEAFADADAPSARGANPEEVRHAAM